MSKKQYPADILSLAIAMQAAWIEIDEAMTFGPLNMAALVTDINRIRGLNDSLTTLETQLEEMRNQRDAACRAAWDKVKRIRAGVKSFYGDDSPEYDLVGGTPISERRRARKTIAAPTE